jgi:predicted nucleotidyltransferase component of viral defense system
MIGRNQFTRLADRDDVDAKTVERDYVLTHIMAGLASEPGHEQMAFKGGTALRLCFFEDYRYSADLDFSLLDGMSKEDALQVVARALENVAEAQSFPHLALSNDGARVHYRGPLGGDRLRDVKLDIAEDEVVINRARSALLARYEDQPSATVVAYTLEEVAAEKLRCVMQRMQARDLFDLHELFVKRGLDVEEVWPDFQAKARHKGKDPDRFGDSFAQRLVAWKRVWKDEMETHVPAGMRPEFGAVERAVTRQLRARLRRRV